MINNKTKLRIRPHLFSLCVVQFLWACNMGNPATTTTQDTIATGKPSTELRISGNGVHEILGDAPERNFIAMLTSKYYSHTLKSENSTMCGGTIVKGATASYLITAMHCLDKRDFDNRFILGLSDAYKFKLKQLDIILPSNRFSEQSLYFANNCYASPGIGYNWSILHYAPEESLLNCQASYFDQQHIGFYPNNNRVRSFSIDKIYFHNKDPQTGQNPDIVIARLDQQSQPYFQDDPYQVRITNGNDNHGLVKLYGWSFNSMEPKPNNVPGRLRAIELNNFNYTAATGFIQVSTPQNKLQMYGGDSGAPTLQVNPITKEYTLLGINSHAGEIAGENQNITNVYHYHNWINSILNDNPDAAATTICEINQDCTIE